MFGVRLRRVDGFVHYVRHRHLTLFDLRDVVEHALSGPSFTRTRFTCSAVARAVAQSERAQQQRAAVTRSSRDSWGKHGDKLPLLFEHWRSARNRLEFPRKMLG